MPVAMQARVIAHFGRWGGGKYENGLLFSTKIKTIVFLAF